MKKMIISVGSLCGLLLFNPSWASEAKSVDEKKPTAAKEVVEYQDLKKAVSEYIKAWQKQDFKTMRRFESWEGGEDLTEVKYIQSFSSNFHIQDWRITKVIPSDKKDEYRVLVLVSHSPPKNVAAYVQEGKVVRSTLNLWWKKQGDKFVHLFHLERERLMNWQMPPTVKPPSD